MYFVGGKHFYETALVYITRICWTKYFVGNATVKVNNSGLLAFDTEKDEKLWITQNKGLTSITTDSRGHLFAVDENNRCVQMFSAVNDVYPVRLCLSLSSQPQLRPLDTDWG